MTIKVLFVDDEPKLLDGLKRSLRPMRHEWETEFATSGHEALGILSHKTFDVIVTDMRMPVMDGAALLKTVAGVYPDLLRIVLSGQSDVEAIVKASGVAHQYLSKPCPLETLKDAIVRAFALSGKLRSVTLRSLISSIDSLPSLPRSFTELTNALDSPASSLAEIGAIISRDVAMSSKILQLMNSAFFGRSRTVSDPGEAVSYLGASVIKALVTGAQAFRCFENGVSRSFSVEELWQHSILCSEMAERIAKDAAPSKRDLHGQARTAGLLHDVGRLALACKLPEQYATIDRHALETKLTLWESEMEIIGVSHAEVGAYLLAFWGLPSPIVEAVAYHHTPFECPGHDFTALTAVHLANGIIRGQDGAHAAPIDIDYLERAGCAGEFTARRAAWESCVVTTA